MMIVNEGYEIAVEDGEGFNEIILKRSSHNGFWKRFNRFSETVPKADEPRVICQGVDISFFTYVGITKLGE